MQRSTFIIFYLGTENAVMFVQTAKCNGAFVTLYLSSSNKTGKANLCQEDNFVLINYPERLCSLKVG